VTDALRKNKIVFVPGKNPKPRPEAHQALLWRCLTRGLELVDPGTARAVAAHPEAFELVSWNELFYRVVKDADEDEPWIEALCCKTAADAADVREALSWRNRRARLLYLIADHLRFLVPLLPDPAVKSTVRESARYFRNHDGIAGQVRELLKAPLRRMFANGDRVLLIGHSMGTIIAYDALWELSHIEHNPGRVDLFLTLGSPLGMHYVQNQLLGFRRRDDQRFPRNVRRWINIAAHGDLTALDPEIGQYFRGMVEQGDTEFVEDRYRGVFNYFRNPDGLNAHRSYGYLVQAHTARAIADWWQGGAAAGSLSPVLAGPGGMA
jgi:pimeloyl-ACP methyl ester carboxylesterase